MRCLGLQISQSHVFGKKRLCGLILLPTTRPTAAPPTELLRSAAGTQHGVARMKVFMRRCWWGGHLQVQAPRPARPVKLGV